MHTTLQDLRYAIRMLTRTPGFTVVALLTLALGIGANTAIFTVVNALLLRPLPYPEPERLVMVWQDWRARGGPQDEWASPGNFADWRAAKDLFADVAAIGGWGPTLTGGAEPESIRGEQVSHEYFRILGITPVTGRDFRPEDDVPNAPRVVLIGSGLWQRRFGGDPGVVGRVLTLNGEPHEVIGILPAGVRPIINAEAEIWRPLRINTASPSRGAVVLRVVGRLNERLDAERAQVAASALARQLQVQYPEFNEKVDFFIQPLHDRVVGEIRPGLLALMGAVAFVLLIACVNIANLLLARATSRGRELAIRAAVGAGRGRMIRQLLTESLVLALIGGAAGTLVGAWAVDGLIALAPANAPRLDEIGLDTRVLAFTAALTVFTGLLFGIAPAVQAARAGLSASLKDGARGASAAGGRGLRRALIAAEVALALVLLTGGGLLLQTFVRLQSADLGFDPQNVVIGSINLPRTSYPDIEKQRAFLSQVLDRASALPGVQHAALSSIVPLAGVDNDTSISIEGRAAPAAAGEQPVAWYREVSAGYFDAMGMRVVKGKAFTAGESFPSVVVNETFARKYFPAEEAIGRRIRWSESGPWFTITGIVGDIRARGARNDTIAEMYIPYWQYAEMGGSGIVLKASNPGTLVGPLKSIVSSLDPNVPVTNVALLSDLVADSIDGPRFFAVLAAGFAVLALLLAAIGIYGVMAYVVAQRTTEMGVRMALGATRPAVFRMVVTDGLRITALGILLGIGGSMIVARALTSLLYGVEGTDPATLGATAGILLIVAAAACFLPARRATRVDPIVALRAE